MSIKKISKIYNIGTRIIKKLLINNNIYRSYEDSLSIAALKGKKIPSKDELNNLYIEKEGSIDEIAKLYGLSHSPIVRLLKKYGIKTRNLKQAAQIRIKKMKKEQLEKFELKKYKRLGWFVRLFSLSVEDEDAMVAVRRITSSYLDKLRNLFDTIGEDNIMEELYLISKNDTNKFDSLLLHYLYNASLKIGIKLSEILSEDCGEFEVCKGLFSNELRKVYIKYTV